MVTLLCSVGLLGLPPVAVAAGPQPLLPAAPVRWVVAPEGNEARYRVREQLAGVDFPNDAVGVTKGITGGLTLDEKGQLVAAESKFTVDLPSLKSDQDRRDRYVQMRTLETATYPSATFTPTAAKGLPASLPGSGKVSFELMGDLTVRGVTRPVIWKVALTRERGVATGTAVTSFTFGEFGLTKPSVAVVLSVEDTITLEYDFRLVRER